MKIKNWLLAIVLLLISWAVFYPFYVNHFTCTLTDSPKSRCYNHLLEVSASMEYYLTKHQNRFPKEWGTGDYAWVEDVKTVMMGEYKSLHCPLVIRTNIHPGPPADYLFNRELAGKKLSEIKEPDETVLLYETGNRHRGWNNYLFVDRHIEGRR
jgi:hypothetical protein